ncbi:MAG: START domain-containing protein [Myxococcota bacterium]|nr:START domain-containing protein [Myxococcota bacterium]
MTSFSAAAQSWEPVDDKDGVQLWQRTVSGSPFIAFRGQMVMKTSIKKLVAIMYDQENKLAWMHDCVANDVLEEKGLGNHIIYNRTAVNVMFVSDRDVVVETVFKFDDQQRQITIDATSVQHPDRPTISGVVRMPKVKLRWQFRVVADSLTEVTYEVEADPGGWLPAWLVNRVSIYIPYHSLVNLEKQTKRPYSDALAVVERKLNWKSMGF